MIGDVGMINIFILVFNWGIGVYMFMFEELGLIREFFFKFVINLGMRVYMSVFKDFFFVFFIFGIGESMILFEELGLIIKFFLVFFNFGMGVSRCFVFNGGDGFLRI